MPVSLPGETATGLLAEKAKNPTIANRMINNNVLFIFSPFVMVYFISRSEIISVLGLVFNGAMKRAIKNLIFLPSRQCHQHSVNLVFQAFQSPEDADI
jgi:hypothetical protein